MRRSAKVHPLAASGPPNCPWTSALSHFQYVPRRVFAFNPDCVLPDLNRRPIAYQAIALSTELNPLAGPIPACAPQSLRRLLGDEIQHAVCRSPTGYLTEHRDAGCPPEPRLSAQTHSLVRLVLACTTRCPSRLTMSVSRVAPPCVLSRACIPGSVPVHEPRWFRASLCRYLRRICQRRQEGRACLGRPNPKVRRDAMGRVPFPSLPAVIGARPLVLLTVFNIHVRRGRRSRAPPVLPLRLPRPMRSTAPALNTIHVVRERFTGAKKNPGGFANRPGLFASLEGSTCKPSRPVVQQGLPHALATIEFMRIHAHALCLRPLRTGERIAGELHCRVPGR